MNFLSYEDREASDNREAARDCNRLPSRGSLHLRQRFLQTFLRGVLCLGLLMTLSACASRIKSDVTRFHAIENWQGKSVVILPIDEAKRGSLEFQQYAGLIGNQLAALGFRPAGEGEVADFEARLDYFVGEGEVRTRYDGPIFGPGRPYYFGSRFFHGAYPYPYYYDSFYDAHDTYSYVVFRRVLRVDLVESESGETKFEGRLESVGRNNHLNEVMPVLAEALFSGFPGENGVTERVIIEAPKKEKKSAAP